MPTQFFYRKNQNSQRFIFQINQIREALCSSDLQATNVQRGFEPMHCNDNRMKTDKFIDGTYITRNAVRRTTTSW